MAAPQPLNPQNFHEGPAAAERFREVVRRIASTPKAELLKASPHKKHPPKKK